MRYRQEPLAPFTKLGPETTVITPGDSRLHLLNAMAGEIWALLEGQGRSLEEIVKHLAARYDAPVERIREEVQAFLDDGVQRGFLLVAASDDGA